MRFFWVPEHPRLPLYRAAKPTAEGKIGEIFNLLTASIHEAIQFDTKAECDAWIEANPHPIFKSVEHGCLVG